MRMYHLKQMWLLMDTVGKGVSVLFLQPYGESQSIVQLMTAVCISSQVQNTADVLKNKYISSHVSISCKLQNNLVWLSLGSSMSTPNAFMYISYVDVTAAREEIS